MSWLLLLRSNWKLIGLGLLALAIAVQTVRLNHRTNQLEKARFELNECREGRKQDREAYQAAQEAARAKNEAEVQRIKSEQERINEKTRSDYQRDLARLRAGGLRKDIAAPPGSPGCAGTGPDGGAAQGADGENVCVSRSLLVRAAEIELARNALIDWVTQQLGVKR